MNLGIVLTILILFGRSCISLRYSLLSRKGYRLRAEATTALVKEIHALQQPINQREYLINLRNQLFLLDEQIWLNEYKKHHGTHTLAAPLLFSRQEELLALREKLLEQHPLHRIRRDEQEAIARNLTYARSYLEKAANTFRRQLPHTLHHINQIAVVSSSGQMLNVVRGQGTVCHPLLPPSRPSSKHFAASVRHQFQMPTFSNSAKFVACTEILFEHKAVSNDISDKEETSIGSSIGSGSDSSTTTSGSSTTTKDSDYILSKKQSKNSIDRIQSSIALVYTVPRGPASYGDPTDGVPVFNSGNLPGVPFFLRFSPDDKQLMALCTQGSGGGSMKSCSSRDNTVLLELDWHRHQYKAASRRGKDREYTAPQSVKTLLEGRAMYIAYTTSSSENATIIAHCERLDVSPVENTSVNEEEGRREKAVWMLLRPPADTSSSNCGYNSDGLDTSAVVPDTTTAQWLKISDGDPNTQWTVPACHSAGGGDSVLVVENGSLVTRALSRWKRGSDGRPAMKRLCAVKGQVQFSVSPDSSKIVVLEEDMNIGYHSLRVIEGETALDPRQLADTGHQYTIPVKHLTVAFWFSPDSTKLLCLTTTSDIDKTTTEESSTKTTTTAPTTSTTIHSSSYIGLSTRMKWFVYDFTLGTVREYDSFRPSPYFMKAYVPFFTQYAQVFSPWAPDSQSFLQISSSGLSHIPLIPNLNSNTGSCGTASASSADSSSIINNSNIISSTVCLGQDAWQIQGATMATWSRT